MNEQYLQEFLKEGQEQITTLNNSLLSLENDPDDEEAMEEIFRTAHTLKGNFAAMGFDKASDLSHALEDLLDEMEEGRIEVTPEIMDLIFEGIDMIEQAMDDIDEHGESQIEPHSLIERVRATMDEEAEVPDAPDDSGTDEAGAADVELDGIEEDDISDNVYQTTVAIDAGELKSADAMIALQSITEDLDVIATDPSREAIEDGEFEESFHVYVDDDKKDDVKALAGKPGPVASVAVTDVPDEVITEDDDEDDTPDQLKSAVDEIESVRIDVDQLDELYRLVEQFVTGHVRLERGVETGDLDSIEENVAELEKTTEDLQDTVIDMRLVPFETIIGKFPRLVRDIAREQRKEVNFNIEGREVEIDRSILSELGDPLTHILRNAVDHGIEDPAIREEKGKPRQGTVELRARRKRDHVVVEVEDDGAGLDVERIKNTAIEKGLRTEEELRRMDEGELYDLVFHPGFSTTDEVTDVSGRGVGMNVVWETINRLDGSINVESEPDEGSLVQLELPVTMAIVRVLILRVGEEEYGIPIKHVDEITTRSAATELDGDPVLKYDEDIYPIIDLADRFSVPETDASGEGNLVRVDESERAIAIGCDQVRAQQTVVVKPLEGMLSGTPGLSGTAILGDGDIMYLLDIDTL